MQRESILFGIIGLLAGSLITIVVVSTAVNNNSFDDEKQFI
ncbi:MAG: hypothetical protein UW69_C0077G0013 [Microgenomates group bacterium GW2011_GWA2_44_7]|nr:MAG: hypothetical protein UW69_C0077G0013 [Microgenomates group bacterium GW2011_GWA2_44_7]